MFEPFYAQIESQSRKIFGGGDERYGNESAIGMDIMDMMNDMPLTSVLMFQYRRVSKACRGNGGGFTEAGSQP